MNSLDIIKELQSNVSLENLGIEVEENEIDVYRNNALGEILHELDNHERVEGAMESLGETLRGTACFYQDMIVAKTEDFEEFVSVEAIIEKKCTEYGEAFNSSDLELNFSTESVVNKAKRAGYTAKIKGKELINKLLTWIKGIFDQYMVADGKMKSFKSLIKKYREKLSSSTPSTKEDVEVSIRKTDYTKLVTDFKASAKLDNIKTTSNQMKSAVDVKTVVGTMVTTISTIMIGTLPSEVKTGIALSGSDSAEKISEIVKDKVLVENFKDYLEDLKGNVEAEDMKPAAAMSYLIAQATKVEAQIGKDSKFKKNIDGFIKAANDRVKKLNKDATDVNVEDSQRVAALGSLVTQYRTQVLSKWAGFVTSQLQALLADMAKVINKNTTIKGN
ncbi:MAG: hypothetical protein ACRC92_14795 [Peptostreptococcaceae bacterium]